MEDHDAVAAGADAADAEAERNHCREGQSRPRVMGVKREMGVMHGKKVRSMGTWQRISARPPHQCLKSRLLHRLGFPKASAKVRMLAPAGVVAAVGVVAVGAAGSAKMEIESAHHLCATTDLSQAVSVTDRCRLLRRGSQCRQ